MKRMLFNATQAEELRVAIVDGQNLLDLDIESAAKEQRKSNIYKAVITRLEPSLEAAFVDYGSDRHGFLPFKEVSRAYFKSSTEPGKARIQDALSVGQELIIQVERDERGNKGAALTTFISLAGRYLVLMPNNPRGGGVSRRIEGEDRQELREVMDQLDVPNGMSLIARTAGIGRSAEEMQWDLNYLMQLWRAIEGAAKSQNGPFLIYQESSLVIRAIRDYFQPDIGEILIDTNEVFEQAQQFMAHVMPANVNRVKRYRDDVPLFSRFQIEHQIESAYSRQVNLPSGGAIVIDHTEALVSVDVNSGRATKGSDIEETAFRTNCEAADETARQLRLRDLGGLIVIDFIDMDNQRNQREVENRLRDALRHDRARVQVSRISQFGLLELSRQRLRPALAETSYITCPRCTGTGHIRSTESAALHILRILEEEAMKENTGALHVQVPVDVGTFLLNEKRVDIARIEVRHRINLVVVPNRHLETPAHEIVRLRHDQLNQEGIGLPSYRMGDEEPEAAYQPPSIQQETNRAPKQEAAVKSFTPAQPAPIVAPAPRRETVKDRKTATKPGFFASILAWFSSPEKKVEAPAPKKEPQQRRERGREDRRPRRDGRDNRRERGDGNEQRTERKERSEAQRNDAPRNENRQAQAPREEQAERPMRENRRQRGERAERPEREPRQQQIKAEASAPVETPLDLTQAAETTLPNATAGDSRDESGNRRRRGRRGGRGRGERRQEGVADEVLAIASQTEIESASDAPSATAEAVVATTAIADVVAEVGSSRPQDDQQVISVASVPVAAPLNEQPAAAVGLTSPSEAPQVFAAASPAIEVSTPASPSEEAPVSTATAQPTPIAAVPSIETTEAAADTAPTIAPVFRPAIASDAKPDSGLVMIETSAAAGYVAPVEPQPSLGRKPKQVVIAPAAALQMVETKPD